MRLVISVFCLSLVSLFITDARAVIIFEDNFNLQPASNGWTEAVTGGGLILDAGTEVELTVSPNVIGTSSITRTISTEGFTDVQLNLFASQPTQQFEDSDFLRVEYSLDGSLFTTLINDLAALNNPISTDVTAIQAFGVDTVFSTGLLALPSGADENSLFTIRISAQKNHVSEDHFLDHLTITGTEIILPEPGTGILFLVGGCFLVVQARRSRMKKKRLTLATEA